MRAILTYHSIDPSQSVVSVHPDRFRQHVDLLLERRVPVVSLVELLRDSSLAGVALTFDDGFENFATHAWPALRAHDLPATLFVPTDWVGRENAWDADDRRIPRLPLLDWPTLRELAAQGLDVGSHSCSHARLPTLSANELTRELEESRAVIEAQLGALPACFAYPYGDYDEHVVESVAAAGYECGVTIELRPLAASEASSFRLPRLDAYYLAKPGVMERWGTPGLERYLRFRGGIRRLRAALRPPSGLR